MARPRRSTSAAPAAEAKPPSSTAANGRSKRPRVSDVDENGASSSASAKKSAKAAPTKTSKSDSPSKADNAKATATKRRRISMLPPAPKNTVVPLPKPFGVLESASGAEWPLSAQLDPRKTGKYLSVFAVGNGDMGQLGMGTDATDELRRPKLHPWFEKNSQLPTGDDEEKKESNGDATKTTEEGDDAAPADKEEEKPKAKQTEPSLGKLGVEDVACGGMHSLVIDSNGKIWSWGINDNGSLGRITANTGVDSDELEYTPMKITELPEEFRAVRVSAADSASLALSENGEVRVWGSFRASDGLLGFDAKTKIQITPIALPGMSKLQTAQIACGENHVLLLTTGGLVYSFGNGESGQLGRHSSARRRLNGLIPERIGHLSDIVHVAAGDNHSFAVKKDGTVYGWGLNLHKQLGVIDADETSGHVSTPIEIEALDPSNHNGAKVVQIGAGTFHSVFLFDNGSVYVCGGNDEHELGLSDDNTAVQQQGENNYVSPPVRLDFPTSGADSKETEIVKLAIGTRHSFALSKNGELFAWGLAGAEQLGCNASGEETVPTPKKVTGKTIDGYKVLGMATGGQHSFIIAAKNPEATNGTA